MFKFEYVIIGLIILFLGIYYGLKNVKVKDKSKKPEGGDGGGGRTSW